MHIRTRNDLINWLEKNAPTPSIKRALQEGSVENLGGFKSCIGKKPGWIVKVTSKFKKIWYISIYYSIVCSSGLNSFIRPMNNYDWKDWIGDKSENKLYLGDNPLLYKELRDNAKTKK